MAQKRWSGTKPLPSDVVEDSDLDVGDSRVPTLGLQHLPSNHPWVGGKQQHESRCDSGVFDSFTSGASSVRSSYADGAIDSMDETSLRDQLKNLSIEQRLASIQQHTSERLPSVDEGFYSTDQKEDSLTTSWNKPYSKIVFPPEISAEKEPEAGPQQPEQQDEDYIDDRILDIFLQDDEGDTKLHMAVIQMAKDVAVKMIELCPDPSCLAIQNDLGQAPLHLAVITKQADIVRNLVVMGAPLEQRDRHGNTPLHLACREGDLACVQALTLPLTTTEMSRISYSVTLQYMPQNMDLWNYEGETCLHMALLKGHKLIIAYLISPHVQANINVKDGRSGRTVLHYAVESGDLETVHFIVANCRSDVNAATFDGSTPLKLAVGRGFHAAANLLVQAGADRSVLNLEESDSSESDDELADEEMFDDIHIGGQPITT